MHNMFSKQKIEVDDLLKPRDPVAALDAFIDRMEREHPTPAKEPT